MDKKGIAELKKRFKKEKTTIQKVSGCYVNGDKNIVHKFTKTFLNLEDDEFYKFLEIAKKCFSSAIGNNMLNLEYPLVEEEKGGHQHNLLVLRDSELKDENITDSFYQDIVDNYVYVGNYLILLFYDAYDIIVKGSDELAQDESEETYSYIICAICPVELSKPSLGYNEDDNEIEAIKRDWIVGVPDVGFIFPNFVDRSTDIHSLAYYARKTKEMHEEFITDILGLEPIETVDDKQEMFKTIITGGFSDSDSDHEIEMKESNYLKIESELYYRVEEDEDNNPIFTEDTMIDVLESAEINDTEKERILKEFKENELKTFSANECVDVKYLNSRKKELEILDLKSEIIRLTIENTELKKQLSQKG